MTFPVSRATRRTFYVEHFKEGYYVARVWEIGAVADGAEAMALMNRALNNAPLERIMGSQVHDEPPTHSRWVTLVVERELTSPRWRVVSRYEDGQPIMPAHRREPYALVEVDVIIPRPKPGQGVRMLTRNDEIARTTLHATEHILRGDLPRDGGR